MIICYIIVLTLATILLGWLAIPKIVELSQELHIYDLPDSRKVHKSPIPRMGGVIFLPLSMVVVCVSIAVLLHFDVIEASLWNGGDSSFLFAYLAGAVILYATGLYDDIHGVGYKVKFLVQFIAAVILCLGGLCITDMQGLLWMWDLPNWISVPLTVISVVYITNAMNLIDGIDGLASGIGIISLIVISLLIDNLLWVMIAMAYVGVLIPFFCYNVSNTRYKTYMGDAGSLTIGYTISFLILYFWHTDYARSFFSYNTGVVAVSAILIPMFDVIRVMIKRICDRRNPFKPDKNHIHHKLLRSGLGTHGTLFTILGLTLLFVVLNGMMAMSMSQMSILVIDILLFVIIQLVIGYFEKRGNITKDVVNGE